MARKDLEDRPVLQATEPFDTPNNSWLKCLLTRKPRMVAAIAALKKTLSPMGVSIHVLIGRSARFLCPPNGLIP